MDESSVKELAKAFKDTHEAREASFEEKTNICRLSHEGAAIKAGVDPKLRTLVASTIVGGVRRAFGLG